jgi:hypothetical protein
MYDCTAAEHEAALSELFKRHRKQLEPVSKSVK